MITNEREEELASLEKKVRSAFTDNMALALFVNRLLKLSDQDNKDLIKEAMATFFDMPDTFQMIKEYPNAEKIALPKAGELKTPLGEALLQRRSIREYSEEIMSLETFSSLLFYTYGVNLIMPAYHFLEFPLRTAPSSGGLAGVEMYVVVNRVEGLEKGLYHYNALSGSVELLVRGTLDGKLLEISVTEDQDFISRAQVVIFLTLVMSRGVWKYFARYYRHAMVDAGCVTQNVYLAATGLGLGACAIAGIDEDRAAKLLQTDPDEIVVLAISCGMPDKRYSLLGAKKK